MHNQLQFNKKIRKIYHQIENKLEKSGYNETIINQSKNHKTILKKYIIYYYSGQLGILSAFLIYIGYEIYL